MEKSNIDLFSFNQYQFIISNIFDKDGFYKIFLLFVVISILSVMFYEILKDVEMNMEVGKRWFFNSVGGDEKKFRDILDFYGLK